MLIRPKAGILDPQGEAVERALPALGFAGVANVHVGRLIELDVEDAGAAASRCASSCSPTRWSRTTRSSCSTAAPTWREVRRPPVSRAPATRSTRCTPRAGSATRSCCGTASATCTAPTRSSCPGGFSYGDYLRAGAIARFAPVMEAVIAFARDGGLVLGICNGFQVLCEAGLLPGALLRNANLRFAFRQVELEVLETADTRVHARAARRAERC